MEQWLILSNEIKYVQYSQHLIGPFALEMKAPEEGYDTKMYKRLQIAEREAQEINCKQDPERMKLD